MTDPNDAYFANEILSLAPANPGWHVHVQHLYREPGVRQPEVEEEYRLVIAAWAVVRRPLDDGGEVRVTEPVFVDGGSLINETEYRRLHADPTPAEGQPEVRIRIRVEPPADPAVGTS